VISIPPKQFLEIFSTRLAYLDVGEGNAIVCLHGGLDCSDTFAPLIGAIPFARVVAFDLPGCGESALPKDPFYSLATTARYIAEALEQKGLHRVVLLGHDHGAAVAALLASLDPERVRGLCLLGSSLSDPGSSGFLLRASSSWPLRWMSRYTLSETMLRWRFNARMSQKVEPERPTRLARFLSDDRRGRLSLLQRIPQKERIALKQKLSSIEASVLLIHGERDRSVSREKAKQRQEAFKSARLELVPACAHYPHEEKPQEVAALLKTWLETIMENG
jgi:3-oxoadipate enol-lactonase